MARSATTTLLAAILLVGFVAADARWGSMLDYDSFIGDLVERVHQTEDIKYSPLLSGYKSVSGGAGEGVQHLSPSGSIDNWHETKTDPELPAYCDPPNPCPVGYRGSDCDPRAFTDFTARFSREYQESQDCLCDREHMKNCPEDEDADEDREVLRMMKTGSVAKKAPHVIRKRSAAKHNPHADGEALDHHIAKKSPPHH